jgi:two-component system phosphate regulon sensor histidine kinase PhoR
MMASEWRKDIWQGSSKGFIALKKAASLDITGSGLGLAICKHIIEAHAQSIHVRSTEHVGTTIGFTLERKKE